MSTTVATLSRAASDPDMRRLQVASAAWSAGEAAYLVGVFVVAYEVAGPLAVSAVAVIRTVPSVVLAPTMAALAADRPVDRSLRWTLAVRFVTVALLGWALWSDASSIIAGLLVAIDSIAATFLRPLRGAALPAVARTPGELVAGNVALTTGDSLANLLGPALAAICLVVAGPVSAFVPGLGGLAIACVAALGLHASTTPVARSDGGPARSGHRLDGLRWLAASPARSVVAMFAIQRLVRGALTVLLVAAAIDLLGMGDAGVGLLTAAAGLGGLVGGSVAVTLVGRERLAPAFVGGIVAWSLGIAVIGIVPLAGVALIALALGGIGKVLIDVAGYTLLQRTTPNAMRTRVLGIQEGLVTAALATGSVLASLLIDAVGIGAAMVIAGGVPILAALVAWPSTRHIDAVAVVPAHEIALLRGVPIFEPLPLAAIEELAAGIERGSAEPGEVVFRLDDEGDRFFIIDRGEVDVVAGDGPARRLGPGGSFGEIALLRDVPRTATVTAVGEISLVAIERSRFLAAVTGNRSSAATAERVVAGHLGRSSTKPDG
jgi:hypothetical protein